MGLNIFNPSSTSALRDKMYGNTNSGPSLDLQFAKYKSLEDYVTGKNLITFTRGSAATYYDANGIIQTAAADEPRFDHDPVTGESLGLLVEESRTNLIRESIVKPDLPGQAYSFWSSFVGGTVIQADAAIAPDNTFTAALVENLTTSTGTILGRYEVALANVSGLIDSIWLKSVSGTTTISLYGSPTSQNTYTSVTVGEEWTRVEMPRPADANYFLKLFKATSDPVSLYVWGAQTEIGSFKTSYIPTSGSTVTRASDVADITGSNFSGWYNQSEGTVFSEYEWNLNNQQNYTFPWYIEQDSPNGVFHGNWGDTTRQRLCVRFNQTDIAVVINIPDSAPGVMNKIASTIKPFDYAVSSNGSTVVPYTDRDLANNMVKLYIGGLGSSYKINGHIKRLTYFPDRLPDATLQAITS